MPWQLVVTEQIFIESGDYKKKISLLVHHAFQQLNCDPFEISDKFAVMVCMAPFMLHALLTPLSQFACDIKSWRHKLKKHLLATIPPFYGAGAERIASCTQGGQSWSPLVFKYSHMPWQWWVISSVGPNLSTLDLGFRSNNTEPIQDWSTCRTCIMVWPPFFPFSSLSSFLPHPSHPLSTSDPIQPHLCQLQGVLMQLCYVHCQTSLGLTLDPLRSGSHAKGYHLYTLV